MIVRIELFRTFCWSSIFSQIQFINFENHQTELIFEFYIKYNTMDVIKCWFCGLYISRLAELFNNDLIIRRKTNFHVKF